jgi:DNA polymerase (family 10)
MRRISQDSQVKRMRVKFMKLEAAELLANQIVHSIEHLCDFGKVMVAGSIRRKRPEVHDIDIVLIPQAWMWNTTIQKLKTNWLAEVVEAGQELARLMVPTGATSEPVQVDIYRARPETWGVLLLIRTGSIEHNIKLCSRARSMNMMLSAAKGVIKDGKVIARGTEEEIFQALQMDYVIPEQREVS